MQIDAHCRGVRRLYGHSCQNALAPFPRRSRPPSTFQRPPPVRAGSALGWPGLQPQGRRGRGGRRRYPARQEPARPSSTCKTSHTRGRPRAGLPCSSCELAHQCSASRVSRARSMAGRCLTSRWPGPRCVLISPAVGPHVGSGVGGGPGRSCRSCGILITALVSPASGPGDPPQRGRTTQTTETPRHLSECRDRRP